MVIWDEMSADCPFVRKEGASCFVMVVKLSCSVFGEGLIFGLVLLETCVSSIGGVVCLMACNEEWP